MPWMRARVPLIYFEDRLIAIADLALADDLPQSPDDAPFWTPVWSHHGIVCTGEVYTKVVKLTFARGASLPDPAGLFNSSLEGNTRRAIDIPEGAQVDARAFQELVKAAVARNAAGK